MHDTLPPSQMIYLDNSATTRLDEDVLEAMLPWLRDGYGNASSIYDLGRRARVAVESARSTIAAALNAHPAEIIFTSGGTESNNAILKSVLHESSLARRLAVGATEHHAVLHPAEAERVAGTAVDIMGVDHDGLVDLTALEQHNRADTLVSLMHANNETGIIQPLVEVRKRVPLALLHSDAVQSFGKIPIDVQGLGVDFLSLSAHKIHGPKGVGAMFIRKGVDFKSHQQGGGQERNRRAGTEPVALIVGFAAAAKKAMSELDIRSNHMLELVRHARQMLQSDIPDVRINTPETGSLPNILNVSFLDADRLDGEAIIQSMDIAGVAVSNGSACVSGSQQPSHVLLAMGRSSAESHAAVRISVSIHSTRQEIERACTILSSVVRNLRGQTHN
ncbi:MAG: cysteine desulfurase [Candidatus Kapabacteria bacterium]|nr:cysteine desulfurase [Candidatus Kapabacteria bacterium]